MNATATRMMRTARTKPPTAMRESLFPIEEAGWISAGEVCVGVLICKDVSTLSGTLTVRVYCPVSIEAAVDAVCLMRLTGVPVSATAGAGDPELNKVGAAGVWMISPVGGPGVINVLKVEGGVVVMSPLRTAV
jgi:hypothetical protein